MGIHSQLHLKTQSSPRGTSKETNLRTLQRAPPSKVRMPIGEVKGQATTLFESEPVQFQRELLQRWRWCHLHSCMITL